MKVDSKKFFIALIVFCAVIVGVGVREYYATKSAQMQKIRESLIDATSSYNIVVGNTYMNRLNDQQITPVESATYIKNLTNLAFTHDIRQLYSVILDANNTLRYGIGNINSTVDAKSLQQLEVNSEEKEKLLEVFKTNQPTFVFDYQAGNHALYVPQITASGLRYLTVAVTEPLSLQKLSQTSIFDTIAKSLLLFLGILPLLIIYRNVLTSTAERLNEEIEFTSEKLHETTTLLEEHVEEKTKELVDEGFLDHLTHLPNRYRLFYDLDRHHYSALIIIHLKNLQELNHFFGITICDTLRQQFALLLAKLNLNAYRLGRDEFVLLVDEKSNIENIESFIESLFRTVEDHPFRVQNENITLQMRMGADTNNTLSLTHADEALSVANDRSLPYFIYEEEKELATTQKEHLLIASSIREAYYDGRIICYYQPIVSTANGKILGYETLARLIDKDATIRNPENFLAIAKKTALYPEISREIIRQACEAFEKRDDIFSVHLCALDLMDHHSVRYIEETIISTNTAHRIVFEICEEDIYLHFNLINNFMKGMRRHGAKISIDNFGSGSSNLMNLLHLHIDYLKIDGSLIGTLTKDNKYLKAIESINLFADSLGAVTIAENVENDEIFTLLKSANIPYVQGFYIGNPSHSL